MQVARPSDRLWRPNAHLLVSLACAGRRCRLVATHDIVSANGEPLWLRGQEFTRALWHELAGQALPRPFESCVRLDPSVSAADLAADLQAAINARTGVGALARPHARLLLAQAAALPLAPAARLLLTVMRHARPVAYGHAVAAMGVAGALAAGAGWARYDLQLALLAGLLHDVGELYLDAAVVEAPQSLRPAAFRRLGAHPSVGAMLLGALTDYPCVLHKAVAEHHERMNGTGYPLRSAGSSQSVLGRLLAAVEAVTGILLAHQAPLARAALALHVVPGEFDATWAAALAQAARGGDERCLGSDTAVHQQIEMRLRRAVDALQAACACAWPPPLGRLLRQAGDVLSRLTEGWRGAGNCAPGHPAGTGGAAPAVMAEEIGWRLRNLARLVEPAGRNLCGDGAVAAARLRAQIESAAA